MFDPLSEVELPPGHGRFYTPYIFKSLDAAYRYKVMWGGRGSAKSWTVARKLLVKGSQRKLRILCTRELQNSITQSVHKLLKDQIESLGLGKFYLITDKRIVGRNGTEFLFMGTRHNPTEIKSTEGIDICWIEEGHNLTEASWDIIDPTVRKEGSEIWITYNTRFKYDHLHKFFVVDNPPPDALVLKANYWDNPFFPEVLRKQMEGMKGRDYAKYLHIWEGELKLLSDGAIFGEQIIETIRDGRKLYIPIQRNCEVDTFWDLGKNDETAIWFMQRVGREYRFIDYYQARLQEVSHYVQVCKALKYNYGKHHLPHDADHDRLGMTKNIAQQVKGGGLRPVIVIPRVKKKNTSIQAARDIFPQCWFHDGSSVEPSVIVKDRPLSVDLVGEEMINRAKRAEKGFEALSNYRYRYLDNDDVFHHEPHHDWASNGGDAYQQFGLQAPKLNLSQRGSGGATEPAATADF